jgi:hemerythrin-like metal-binding protein
MTTPIERNQDLRVGVPAIDAEHQALLDICDQFLFAAESGQPVAGLEGILASMISHARDHFTAEERVLDRIGYPALATHKAEHRRLMAHAESLQSHWGEVERERIRETADYLRAWLLDHIRTEDRSFRTFLMRLA